MSDLYPSDWNTRRAQVLRRDNFTCQNCGAKGGPQGNSELHIHHSVPISSGGSHKISNLITHCKQCHQAIHGKGKAPTAANDPHGTSMDEVEMPTFSDVIQTILWWVVFFMGFTIHPVVSLVWVAVWLGVKYKSYHESEEISAEIYKSYREHTSSLDPTSNDRSFSSSGKPETSNQRTKISETKSTGDAPFDWYGDDEVPVETVLDYIETDLDPKTRQRIVQSVEDRRNKGEMVDPADIRWVANASAELEAQVSDEVHELDGRKDNTGDPV